MAKILHLADLHLGWEPRFLGPKAAEYQQERDNILEAIVDFTLLPANEIELVLIVGDLFDEHNPEQALVNKVINQLKRLVDQGIKVVTVPGNHDEITYPNSVYRQRGDIWPGILVRNPHPEQVATLNLRGGTCYFYSLAYTGGLTKTSPPIEDFPHNGQPGWHLAAFHGSLDWDAGDRSLPLSSVALGQAGYDYVALGHIHKPMHISLSHGLAVYPGSLAAKGWNDPGSGQLTVVSLTDSGARVEKHALDHSSCRGCRILEIDAGQYQSVMELIDSLKNQLQENEIVSICLHGVPDFIMELELIRNSLAERCYYLEIADTTAIYPSTALTAWAQENTLRGYYVHRMQEMLTAAKDEREQRLLTRALVYGLTALEGEQQ